MLDTWFVRQTEKDVVVKLHTGGGKTPVALSMAQSVTKRSANRCSMWRRPTNLLAK